MSQVTKSPKSRKPATKAIAQPPAAQGVAAQLAATVAAAPAPKPTAKRAAPDLKLVVAKQFKPRTDQLVDRKTEGKGNFAQQHNWDALVAAIQAHGGVITYAEAVQAVADAAKAGGYEKTANARGFVQGRVRNGHLAATA